MYNSLNNKSTIFISFFNSWPITSGASAVTTSLYNAWPGEKMLFMMNHEFKSKSKGIVNFNINSNKPIFKLLCLIFYIILILIKIRKKKIKYFIFEGASWSGYIYFVYKFIKLFYGKVKFIYHSHNVDYYFRKQQNFFIRTFSFFFEKDILQNFDISTSVSKSDQKLFKKIFKVNTTILENGLNLKQNIIKKRVKKYLFFPGSLEYQENKIIFQKLVQNEFLILKKYIPDICLLQSGGGIISNLKNKNIKLLGRLNRNDYLAYLKNSLLIVIPAKKGPGTKIKIIEALCYSVPVLSTKNGINGLNFKESNYITYKNLTDFKNKIYYFSKKKFKTNKLNNIYKYFRKRYSMKKIVNDFIKKNL